MFRCLLQVQGKIMFHDLFFFKQLVKDYFEDHGVNHSIKLNQRTWLFFYHTDMYLCWEQIDHLK